MKVDVHRSGDVTILDLRGTFSGLHEEVFNRALQEALDSGAAKLVINLRDVSRIDSSGVGQLVSGYATATNRGVRLNLAELPGDIRHILTITGLITSFDVYGSVDEAVRSFA